MQSDSSTRRNNLWLLARYVVLGFSLLLVVSACSRKPNLIPYGFGEVFDDPARASTAARVDYPLLYTMDAARTSIIFRVSENGERNWFFESDFWNEPRWKSKKWYQVTLIPHGMGDAVCVTELKNPNPNSSVTEIECTFAQGKKAGDYFDEPMAALLDYYVDGSIGTPPGDKDQPTETLSRILYIIPKK